MSDENLIRKPTHTYLWLSQFWAWARESETVWFGVFLSIAVLITIGALTASTGYEDIAGIARQVDGTAYRPYVYRQLVPMTIRLISTIIPTSKWMLLENMGAESEIGNIIQQLESDFVLNILSSLVNLLCLMGFAYIFRTSLRDQLIGPKLYFNITVACALYGLAYTNHEGVYSYDYPVLFLYTTAILLMSRRVWWAYYPIFLLAVINKETTVLLIGVYVLSHWQKHNSRKFVFHLLTQMFVYTLITLVIRCYFSDNPGSGVEVHFLRNIRLLANPPDVYDFPLLMLILLSLVVKDWHIKPILYKYMLIMLLPLAGLGLVFGWIDELRDYYEVYPAVMALASMPIATYFFNISLKPNPTTKFD